MKIVVATFLLLLSISSVPLAHVASQSQSLEQNYKELDAEFRRATTGTFEQIIQNTVWTDWIGSDAKWPSRLKDAAALSPQLTEMVTTIVKAGNVIAIVGQSLILTKQSLQKAQLAAAQLSQIAQTPLPLMPGTKVVKLSARTLIIYAAQIITAYVRALQAAFSDSVKTAPSSADTQQQLSNLKQALGTRFDPVFGAKNLTEGLKTVFGNDVTTSAAQNFINVLNKIVSFIGTSDTKRAQAAKKVQAVFAQLIKDNEEVRAALKKVLQTHHNSLAAAAKLQPPTDPYIPKLHTLLGEYQKRLTQIITELQRITQFSKYCFGKECSARNEILVYLANLCLSVAETTDASLKALMRRLHMP